MPYKSISTRAAYILKYMQERRAGCLPRRKAAALAASRYLSEATFTLCGPESKRPYVAMVIWRDAANGSKPAQAALTDPMVAACVGRMLVRAWTRKFLGLAQLPVPKSLAESTTPEVRRVAHLVDQPSSRTA